MLEPRASSELERRTRMIFRRWQNGMAAKLKTELTTAQFYMLEAVRDNKLNCTVLADTLQITLPAVTNLANKLVAGGYIERVPADSDRRVIHLRITEQGLKALQELDRQAAQMAGELWSALTPDETEQLNRLLGKALEAPLRQ